MLSIKARDTLIQTTIVKKYFQGYEQLAAGKYHFKKTTLKNWPAEKDSSEVSIKCSAVANLRHWPTMYTVIFIVINVYNNLRNIQTDSCSIYNCRSYIGIKAK